MPRRSKSSKGKRKEKQHEPASVSLGVSTGKPAAYRLAQIGNLMQTRHYAPGRMFWGAVTANLTRWLGGTNYRETGKWVQDHLCFGYFFPAEDPANPLYPVQGQGGTVYGKDALLDTDFERGFLNSLASTAIAAEANAAQEGSLHEVEFITPSLGLDQPVYLVGHLFVHQGEEIAVKEDDVEVQGISLFTQVMTSLQIGGELRYGFGRLALYQDQCRRVNNLFGYDLNQQEGQYWVTVPAQRSLLAHTMTNGLRLNGPIEPLVSREWVQEHGRPGRQVTLLGLYYAPGSVVATETTLFIGRYGIWEQVV